MKIKAKITGALAAMSLFCGTLVQAQVVAAPEYVPANVEGIISINDAGKLWSALGQTAIRRSAQQVLSHPVMAQNPGYQDLRLAIDKASLELGYGLYPDQFLGPVLEGFDLYAVRVEGQAAPQVLAVGEFASGEQAAAMSEYIKKKINERSELLKAQGVEGLTFVENSIGGMTVTSVPDESLHFGNKGEVLFVSTNQTVIQSALESPGAAERFAGNAELAAAMGKLGEANGELFIYGDGDRLNQLMNYVPQGSAAAGAVGNMGTMAGFVAFLPDRINVKFFNERPEGEASAMPAATPPSSQVALLQYASASPLAAFTMNYFDGQSMAELEEMEAASMPMMSAALEQMRTLEQQLGLSFEEDIAPAFGPDAAFFLNSFSMKSIMALDADVLAVFKVKDEAKARKTLQAFTGLIHNRAVDQARAFGINAQTVAPTEETYKGAVINSVPYQNPMINMPMGLSYAFTDDGYVLISLAPETVKAAIDRKTSEAAGITASPQWETAQQFLPAQFNQMAIINFNNIGTLIGTLMPLVAQFAQVGQQEMGLLMNVVELVKSFGTSVTVTGYREDGMVKHATFLLKQ